jgi:hypothetical protein
MRRIAVLLAVVLSCLLGFAQDNTAKDGTRGPSTRAERDRALKVTKELEADPLAPQYRSDRAWLIKWIQDIPDITVQICVDPVEGNSNYRYNRELLLQKTFASAAYIIQHSVRDRDDISVETAGVEGALKAYESILKRYPQAHSPYWDRLLKKRDEGTLRDYVARYMEAACGSEQQQA